MSSQRYTPEFKDEAVRQVVERGHTVAEIAKRLGVSSHSLYKWVKAATPDQERGATEPPRVHPRKPGPLPECVFDVG